MTSPEVSRRRTIGGLLASAAVVGGGAGALAGTTAGASSATPPPSSDAGALLLRGSGIDETGRRDSRAAVQALLDAAPAGATIVNPSGAVLRIDGGLTVRQAHTRLTGSGEWCFRRGGEYTTERDGQNGFIDLRADHCWVDGIHATNPDGVLNRGVIFLADYGRATSCTLIGFGAGIHVSPAGEFHDFIISGNHVLDVLGDGGGSEDTGRGGESYGDGIMCWGSSVTITGNVVTCKDGADARIGIHVEGLSDQAAVPWVHDHQMALISGNIVHGRFRRGIVSEAFDHVAITGNTVADATWWSIALISANHCVVSGNVILYTRASSDTQGSAWNPSRSAVMLYAIDDNTVVNPIVVENSIRVLPGGQAVAAVRVQGNDPAGQAVVGGRVAGNRIHNDGSLQHGVLADQGVTDLEVDDNRIVGFSGSGITLGGHRGAKVRRNTVSSTAAPAGIRIGSGSGLTCDDNVVVAAATGVTAQEQHTRTTVNGNAFERCGTGVDLSGSSGAVLCNGNVFSEVERPMQNLPAAAIALGNSQSS